MKLLKDKGNQVIRTRLLLFVWLQEIWEGKTSGENTSPWNVNPAYMVVNSVHLQTNLYVCCCCCFLKFMHYLLATCRKDGYYLLLWLPSKRQVLWHDQLFIASLISQIPQLSFVSSKSSLFEWLLPKQHTVSCLLSILHFHFVLYYLMPFPSSFT